MDLMATTIPDIPTPGQVNYEAYDRALYGTVIVPWRIVVPESKCAWEAAAQAVRAMKQPTEEQPAC